MRARNLNVLIAVILCLFTIAAAGTICRAGNEVKKIPPPGSAYTVDGQKTIVVAGGDRAFEYVSKGESLILIYLQDPSYKSVIVADEGVRVKVDPSKPSCQVGGVEKLDSMWKKGTYLLVEYDRANN